MFVSFLETFVEECQSNTIYLNFGKFIGKSVSELYEISKSSDNDYIDITTIQNAKILIDAINKCGLENLPICLEDEMLSEVEARTARRLDAANQWKNIWNK